ncbi:MAG: hypothetical protein J5950_05625 [Clostridia bacterium]|nr:hypothetical protein [Clostridia bacterium]
MTRKRSAIFAAVTAAVVLISSLAGSLICFAGQDDENVKNAQIEELIVPDPFAEDAYGLRGFTVSPDGERLFLGYLHGPYGDASHVSLYDARTLRKTGEYIPVVDENIPVDMYNYYPKGLAVDNRGFLFVGVTHAETPYCSIYCVDNYLREIGHIVEDLGETTGINGIATQKMGDRILLYVLTCYNADTIRCYDVTDPTDMKLYEAFGDGGVVDYNELTGSERDPGYIAVDIDGNVYITCMLKSSGSKGSHVLKLSPDGKEIVARVAISEAYGICTAGDYLFVSTYDYDRSKIYALNRSDLSEVAVYSEENQSEPLTSISYGGQFLYIADQGEENPTDAGRVLRTKNMLKLTRDARETEKVDPGKYEVPPTAEPTEEPENGENTSDTTHKRGNTLAIVLGIAGAVLAAAVVIVLVVRSKRKK